MRSPSRNYSDHHHCAHAWAHQLSPAGHASNLHFSGATIYSYGNHFPIATLEGNRVFFTTESYSRSTAKHKSRVRSAVSHLDIVYVKHVPVSEDPATEASFIRKNLRDWTSEIRSLTDTLERHPRRVSLVQQINGVLSLLRTFISELGIVPDPALQEVLDAPSLREIAELHAARRLKAAEAERKKLAILSKLFSGVLKTWRDDLSNKGSLYNPEDANLAYLRWNEGTGNVETSKGIDVPLEVAKKCYDFLQRVLPDGCADCNFSLLGFRISSISSSFLTVGCHKIPMAEVSAIAGIFGWDQP